MTKSLLDRAVDMHASVYSGVSRLPSELICARRRSPRAWGGGPSSSNALDLSLGSPSPMESARIREVGWRGDVGSKV